MTSVQRIDETVEPTINAAVSRQLRADILARQLLLNERLRVDALRERYGLGGSAICEVVMRLEAEGLATLVQNNDFRVSPVSKEHLIDLMKLRSRMSVSRCDGPEQIMRAAVARNSSRATQLLSDHLNRTTIAS